MERQLFYGKFSNVTPYASGSGQIRFRGNYTSGSDIITNLIPQTSSGYNGWEAVQIGQPIRSAGETQNDTVIVNFDEATATITMSLASLTTATNQLTQISPPAGTYWIPSASFTDPQSIITVNQVTGSQDNNYNGSTPIYSILLQAANSLGSAIPGRFHKYSITSVVQRKSATQEISFFATWDEQGTEAESGDTALQTPGQVLPAVALSATESLAPIFSRAITGLSDVANGGEVA